MIRMRDLAISRLEVLGNKMVVEDGQVTNTPPGTTSSDQQPKAQLMSLAKQTAELYNMVGDGEQLEPEIQEKLSAAVAAVNDIHMSVQYKKQASPSLGNGDGTPSVQESTKDVRIDALDKDVRDSKEKWVGSMASREKAEAESAEERREYIDKLHTLLDKKKKLGM